MRKHMNLVLAVVSSCTALIWLVNILIDIWQGHPLDVSALLLTGIWTVCAVLWLLRWRKDVA